MNLIRINLAMKDIKDMKEKDFVLGIDMGGTNTEFAVVNARGEIIGRDSIPTVGHKDIYDFVSCLKGAVDALLERTGTNGCIRAIGVGAPCANQYTGCIEAATDLPWDSPIPLASLLERAFSLPTSITNDANAAAAGEMAYGHARGLKNFIMITLGTGVGSGIVCDGHLLSGSRGFAGELGHVLVRGNGDRLCGCGRYDCLETYCSAKGIVRTAKEMLHNSDIDSELRSVPEESLSAKTICEAARRGDVIAKDVYEFTGKILGEACANFAAFTDPEAYIIFGGVAKAGDLIVEPMRQAMERNMLHLYKDRVEILFSSLKDAEAALLGASALAWDMSEI